MGDAPGSVPGSTTNKANYKSANDMASKSAPVVIGQGESKVTFSVNVSADGGGNPFSGKSPEQQKVALAKLIFGDNPRAVALLEQLTDKLAAAGIKSADINVDSAGKLDITNISTKERLPNEKPEKDGPSLAKFIAINYGGDTEKNKILMAIFSIALEARSDVIKMIIEAMEKNHQMWMAMLKELAVKITKDKQEQKAIMQRLMAKLAVGDREGAKGIVALLVKLGCHVTLTQQESLEKAIGRMKERVYTDIDKALAAQGNLQTVLDENKQQISMLGLTEKQLVALQEAVAKSDINMARKVLDSSFKSGFFDGIEDSYVRWRLGLN
jgi:hypothetical protein